MAGTHTAAELAARVGTTADAIAAEVALTDRKTAGPNRATRRRLRQPMATTTAPVPNGRRLLAELEAML